MANAGDSNDHFITVETGPSFGKPLVIVDGFDREAEPPTYEEAINPSVIPPPSYESLFGRVKEAHRSSKGILDFTFNLTILVLGTIGCSVILIGTVAIPIGMIVVGSLYMYQCPQGENIPVYLLVGDKITIVLNQGPDSALLEAADTLASSYLLDIGPGESNRRPVLFALCFANTQITVPSEPEEAFLSTFARTCLLGVLKELLHLTDKVRNSPEIDADRIRHKPAHTLLFGFMVGWFILGSVWVYELYEPNYDPEQGPYCNKTLYLFAYWLITSVYIFLAFITFCVSSLAVTTFWLCPEQSGC